MSECNETLQEMYSFLDGELTPAIKADIQQHIDGCSDCLGAYAFHVELQQMIVRKASTEPVPPGLMDRIRQCFGDE